MKIKIRVESLPLHFIVLGVFLIIYGISSMVTGQSIGLNSIFVVVGILLATSHQAVTLNTSKKNCSEYYWMTGIKLSNNTESYNEILSIVCSSGNYSQEYGKYNRRQISGTMFKGYIEFLDKEALFIGQNKSKTALLKRLERIGAKLEVSIKDNTSE